MMVPPLSERPVTEEDEEQFRRETAPRKYTLRQRWADYRAEVKDRRPKGARARARAWLHVEPFYWGMRVTYVALFAGAVFAVYINGVAEGWWPAWGERPTVAATTTAPAARPVPTASATAPGEHYLALMVYAFNTGDTQPFADMSSPTSGFASAIVSDIHTRYEYGWNYGMESNITYVLRVDPIEANGKDVPEGSIVVKYRVESYDGTKCTKTKVHTAASKYKSTLSLIMTWHEGRWIETQGRFVGDEEN